METVSTLASSPRELTIGDLEQVSENDEDHTEALVHLGKQLGLIQDGDSGYAANRSIKMQVRQSTTEQRKILLGNLLQQYDPFIAFTSSLIQGSSSEQAGLQATVVYELDVDPEIATQQLIELATYANLFSEEDETLSAQFDTSVLTDEFIEDLYTNMKKPLIARLFLENRLGDEIVGYMDTDTFDELENSLELFWERPRSSIAAAGRAVEDFLRDLGSTYGSNQSQYSQSNGIGQLIQALQSDGLIKKRHLHGGNYLAGVRNPSGGHGKDPDELERWDVSPEVALGYVLAAIHFIRSIYEYVEQGRLVL
jgi:hypothetical protein